VQQTNCHPFRHGNWLWMHNGLLGDFQRVKRELVLAVDPALYPSIEGSTDSEVFFYLALTMGLEDDPPGAQQSQAFQDGRHRRLGERDERRLDPGVPAPLPQQPGDLGDLGVRVRVRGSPADQRDVRARAVVARQRRVDPLLDDVEQ